MIYKINLPNLMKVEMIKQEDDFKLTTHQQITIQRSKQVDQLLLDELYKIYKDKADMVILINETEFEEFIKKYLPFYLKEIYPFLNKNPEKVGKDLKLVSENLRLKSASENIVKRNVELIEENKKLKKVIKFLKPHTHLASGLCEIKLADEEVSRVIPKYHNGKEVYEPKYYKFYELFKEVLDD